MKSNTKHPVVAICLALVATHSLTTYSAQIRVPEDYDSIQKAIDAAKSDDIVLVAPGTYHMSLKIEAKTLTLASHHLTSNDPKDIEATILDGGDERGKPGKEAVITVGKKTGPQTRITGFTVRNGDDGITCAATINIDHNRFLSNGDAIDYEGGGGRCHDNFFDANRDDAIDLDGPCTVTIENNTIRNNKDDGIEMRLHPYKGARLVTLIRNNRILGNGEDGIQLIDYEDLSDRLVVIEGNVIAGTAMAAIGCMDKGDTKEDYRAAGIPEKIYLLNNTLLDNEYGLTGGANMVVVNNIIARTRKSAVKACAGNSILKHNLLWANGQNNEGSSLYPETTIEKDPLLDNAFLPRPGSPAIDAGIPIRPLLEKDLSDYSERAYKGSSPDLGAFDVPAAGR